MPIYTYTYIYIYIHIYNIYVYIYYMPFYLKMSQNIHKICNVICNNIYVIIYSNHYEKTTHFERFDLCLLQQFI